MSSQDYVRLWESCLSIIKDNLPRQAYNTWFLPIVPVGFEDNKLTLKVPSQFFYEYLEEHYIDLLRKTIHRVMGEETQLMYEVQVTQAQGTTLSSTSSPVEARRAVVADARKTPQMPVAEFDSQLNGEYNFDTFIEGSSNKLSRSVGEAIAENPGKTIFNPLFLYGESGVGKTHLANAIGNRIKERFPEKRVLYVSAHLFQVQYTTSVRDNKTNDFLYFYQSIDVLIVDDIQELAGVTKTQNTFFHIFNHLHQNGKQLILTADRAPVLLQGMDDRMITRFKWGMMAELERPNLELRKRILCDKMRRNGLQFPADVIDYIAEEVDSNVRDLEGIVNSIMAYSIVYNKEIDLELAMRTVRKVVESGKKEVTVDDILRVVCRHYHLEPASIHTKSRKREVVQARQIAMYLAKDYTDLSTAKIGSLIGNRDHATVLHAFKTVKELGEVDKSFRAELDEIQSALKREAR
ncbi:MAG: chromosomal replication initiator protein DnaA [Prevotellaceae bacterium]|nr:chromosomal replication initiator protein DnaA [Prevotellaceae bacterium]